MPINSVVQSALFDLSLQRRRADDRDERVFSCGYVEASKFFPKAVERARLALKAASKDGSHLEGYTWHGNRHTFASRLAMAGVDARTLQELGGWKSLKMVKAAVERLVPSHATELARN